MYQLSNIIGIAYLAGLIMWLDVHLKKKTLET